MTVNVEKLVNCFGLTHQQLLDGKIINYKTPPKGTQSDESLTLDMKKEGIFLSFDNTISPGKPLKEITLTLHDGNKKWVFPNELPFGLKKEMNRKWVHENFGNPEKSIPPMVIMKEEMGWYDRYSLKKMSTPTTIVFQFDLNEYVETVTFIPTVLLRW